MLKKILPWLGGVLVLFVLFVAFQPSEIQIQRSAQIQAPAAVVFAHVNNFHNWEAWSPWAKMDPTAKTVYEGPTTGEGAAFGWDGNREVGSGKMTITQTKPNELIKIRLDFERPFKSTDESEFTFTDNGPGASSVTWKMIGHKNFVSKLFCLFMDMDKMVGGQFEKGLADLKSVSEKSAKR